VVVSIEIASNIIIIITSPGCDAGKQSEATPDFPQAVSGRRKSRVAGVRFELPFAGDPLDLDHVSIADRDRNLTILQAFQRLPNIVLHCFLAFKCRRRVDDVTRDCLHVELRMAGS
jgi:hypothetical protein